MRKLIKFSVVTHKVRETDKLFIHRFKLLRSSESYKANKAAVLAAFGFSEETAFLQSESPRDGDMYGYFYVDIPQRKYPKGDKPVKAKTFKEGTEIPLEEGTFKVSVEEYTNREGYVRRYKKIVLAN